MADTTGLSGVGLDFYSDALKSVMTNGVNTDSTDVAEGNTSFDKILNSAMNLVSETDSLAAKAEEEAIDFTLGNTQSTHEMAIAQQKAYISLQYTVAVKNAQMNEKVKDVQEQLLAFWNKYDKKRKIQMISVVAAVIIMLIILAVVVSKPTYVTLIECQNTVDAASVTDILTSNSIKYTTENESKTILVEDKDLTTSTYLIAQNGYTAKGYTMEDYSNSVGIGTTSSDRERFYQKYLEDKMIQTLESFDYVKSADVSFSMPTTTYSVLEDEEETFVAVKLTLSKNMPEGAAENMAKYIATAVGNDSTSRVTIVDSNGNSLFVNEEVSDSVSMTATQMENIRKLYRDEVVTNVSKVFVATGYQNVTVAPVLDITFDKVDVVDTQYTNPENVKYNDYIYEQEGGTGSGGIPGTDSNDDDSTYYIDTGDSTTTSVTINKNEYAVSSTITHREGEQGKCDYDNSSVTVVLNKYQVYHGRSSSSRMAILWRWKLKQRVLYQP